MEWPRKIKEWVVINASVTNPYKKYWSASVTLCGMDINGIGGSIEKAYNDLTCNIINSKMYREGAMQLIEKQTNT